MHTPHWIVLAAWILGWVLFWRLGRVPRSAGGPGVGPVTVVVPARDEALRLPRLLEALTPGLRPEVRVLVVDDHSTDGTAEVARSFPRVEVVQAPALPEGWTGKTWACQQGALVAREGELVFLDADVRITAEALEAAIRERTRLGGLLSIWPYQEAPRPYEQSSALFHVVTLMALGAASLVPPRRMRGALGSVLLTHTRDHARVGGHAAVRHAVVEDLALGRLYADAGLLVRVVGGDRDIACRMYGEGFGGLLRGWMKSLGGGVGSLDPLRFAALGVWLACGLGAPFWVGGIPKPLPIAFTSLYVVQMAVLFRQVGRFHPLQAVLYPVHVLLVIGVLLVGLLRTHVLRRVVWRGRTYEGPPAAPDPGPHAEPRPPGPPDPSPGVAGSGAERAEGEAAR